MAAIQKVVLMGASGVLGSAILHALCAKNDFEITVLTRPESQTTFPSDVTVVRTDYSLASLQQIFQGHHAVICALGLSTIPDQKTYIDACTSTGVYRYITNDFGNAPEFAGLPELEFARKPKQEILEYVQHQAAKTTTTTTTTTHDNDNNKPPFTWTALATGHFLDYAIKKFPTAFGFDLSTHTARLIDNGTEPFSATTLGDIGYAVSQILRHPTKTANKYLLIRTLETTQLAILDALRRQTGDMWPVEHVASAELYEVGKRKMRAGDRGGAILSLLPVQIFEAGKGRSTFPWSRYDNEVLGVRERSVDDVVREVLASG